VGQWTDEGAMWETLVAANIPGRTKRPNRAFSRPPPGPTNDPAFWQSWDVGYDSSETIGVGRLSEVYGYLDFVLWQQANTGDSLIRAAIDGLKTFAKAVTDAGSGRIKVDNPIPGEYGTLEDPSAKSVLWYGRAVKLPFHLLNTLSAEEVAGLAGLSSASTTFTTETDHPFAMLDCVGLSEDGWRLVTASEGEPRCEGVVTLVPNARSFVLTTSGAVKMPVHGLTTGPLFLSQLIAGELTASEPVSGTVRRMATAVDADWLIVLSLPEVVL
jgi:hypothetical protein